MLSNRCFMVSSFRLLYKILLFISISLICVSYFLFPLFSFDNYILHPNLPYVKYQYYSFNHMYFIW